jgi:leucyl-tRNA synthetase
MNPEYEPQSIEHSIQTSWDEKNAFKAIKESNKEKFYCLSMLPYPSGRLHMGHVRNYTIGDVISRFQRMNGKNVMQPMGWDAFGLPAENAAIKNKTQPRAWTIENISSMKKQLKSLGFAFDWDREITTCQPEYYQWEQWFFTQLIEKNLAYKKTSSVNWCPTDQTVLANEQVHDGRCWRCETPVEKKSIDQWFLRITHYAEELLSSIDSLEGWPESVKAQQRHWIGRSEGLDISFLLNPQMPSNTILPSSISTRLSVYTTRPDTLMGVTYLAIASEHPLALWASKNDSKIERFVAQCRQNTTAEADLAVMKKEGVFSGFQAIHPITKESIDIWIANFVLMEYGSGAVMSVPAHDQRDWGFAKQYHLPIRPVIIPYFKKKVPIKKTIPSHSLAIAYESLPFTKKGQLIHSGIFDGLTSDEAFIQIADYLEKEGLAKKRVNYRLRDWGISRQRFWGTPIPMIQLETGKWVVEKNLPVVLPNLTLNSAHSPLIDNHEFQDVWVDGVKGKRETDTFDTFMESSWYYARYTSSHCHSKMLDSDEANYWLPVDHYIGGIEHATMHLLYFRFFHKLMRDMGLVSSDEPAKKLLTQGMVLSDTFLTKDKKGIKQYHSLGSIDVVKDDKGKITKASLKSTGESVILAGMEKMSKSKNNGIDPQALIEQYGADTARLYTMFAAPPEQTLEWKEDGVHGAFKFLRRLWKTYVLYFDTNLSSAKNDSNNVSSENVFLFKKMNTVQKKLYVKTQQTIQKVSDDYERRYAFNTAIASIMELMNTITESIKIEQTSSLNSETTKVIRYALKQLVLLLSPVTPHICQALWQNTHPNELIVDVSWPICDQKALIPETVLIILQVNGKTRGKIHVPHDLKQKAIEKEALEHIQIQKHISNKKIKKIIFIPSRLMNIVVES